MAGSGASVAMAEPDAKKRNRTRLVSPFMLRLPFATSHGEKAGRQAVRVPAVRVAFPIRPGWDSTLPGRKMPREEGLKIGLRKETLSCLGDWFQRPRRIASEDSRLFRMPLPDRG